MRDELTASKIWDDGYEDGFLDAKRNPVRKVGDPYQPDYDAGYRQARQDVVKAYIAAVTRRSALSRRSGPRY